MCSISGELWAMIDEELRKEPATSHAQYDERGGISAELYRMIDEEQKKDLPLTPAEKRWRLEAPPRYELPPDVEAARQAADAAYVRVDEELVKLRSRYAPRAPMCGKGPTHHLRRRTPGGVQDALARFACGRSDCPFCHQRRIERTLTRAANCLLDGNVTAAERESGHFQRLPRVGPVHVAETDWFTWQLKERTLRRRMGGGLVGRLRVRRDDNTVLIVSERPFPGSRPMAPAEALELVIETIHRLNPKRSAYRQLGPWSDRQPSKWREVALYPAGAIDFTPVAEQILCSLEDLRAQRRERSFGPTLKLFQRPEAAGLTWETESEEMADLLIAACPLMAIKDEEMSRPQTDTAGDAAAGQEYYPSDNPFS